MSDKRSTELSDREDSSKKRKVLNELSESGPLTQKDVVYFQKEAIFRQLVQYKSKAEILQNEVTCYSKKYELYKSRLLLILTWIDQFIDVAAHLVQSSSSGTSHAERFLISFDKGDPKDEGELMKKLEEKKIILNNILSNLSSSKSGDFTSDLSNLSKSIYELKALNEELTTSNELTNSKYETLNAKYLDLVKHNERLDSKTVNRFYTNKKEETAEVKKESTPQTNGASFDQEMVEKLKEQLKEQSSTIETQENIIKGQLDKLSKLNDEISNKFNQSELKSSDVRDSSEYQDVLSNYERLNIEHNESLQKYDLLKDNFAALEAKSHELNDILNKQFSHEKGKIIEQFSRLENDLIRIRTARDELLSKVSILEAEKSSSAIVKELKDLLEEQSNYFNSKSIVNGEIIGDDEDLESLKKKNSILTQELQSLESAFKSLQTSQFEKTSSILDFDSQITKYKIEKQKADQKYFAAMRSKDSLNQEIRTLKELVKALELKNSTLEELKQFSEAEFSSLEAQIANSNKLIGLKDREITTLSHSISTLEIKRRQLEKETQQLRQNQSNSSESYTQLIKSETELKLKLSKVESQLSTTREQLTRFKTIGNEAVNQEELSQYRSLIYCSLCSKNWKNTVIKNCGHFFCEECTKERLAARMRKCPSCNKQFSSNDLLTVHL